MNTLGLVVGNRGFFPDHLCASGREAVMKVLAAQDIQVVALPTDATKFGAVESLDDARSAPICSAPTSDKIDGVVVTLPNFGDERAVANTLRWANLDVPVLVHAFDDAPGTMTIKDRRDAFCGKMSVCNNLRQYDIPYSLTKLHTVDPTRPEFAGRRAAVRGDLPRDKKIQECAGRSDRRTAGGVQYRSLQRKDFGALRHHDRDARSLRDSWLDQASWPTTIRR